MTKEKELNFKNITIKTSAEKYLNNIKTKALLIYSTTSLAKIKITNSNIICINYREITKKENNIKKYSTSYDFVESVIGLGGGSAIDVAKYVAFTLNKKFICIPSILSTNAYSTNSIVVVKDDGCKKTVKYKMPNKIIFDKKIIKEAGEINLLGLVDVLSIYTACIDWKLAENNGVEKVDLDIYKKAQDILLKVINLVENNTVDEILDNVEGIYNIIGDAGYITNIYGCGRPESGSEHIFASLLEKYVEIPHGIAVGLGIAIMSTAQKCFSNQIKDILVKLGVFKNLKNYNINKDFISMILNEIKPRKDRFTIINLYDFNNENIKAINNFIQIF